MASHSDTCDRWVRRVQGADLRELQGSRIVARGDRIYSYGTHFELARPLRDKQGALVAWLLNGDRYSVSTTQHQSHIRDAIRRLGGGLPLVIIPHSALASAGVVLDSIEIIEATPDTMVPVPRSSTRPHKWWHRDDRGRLWTANPQGGGHEVTEHWNADGEVTHYTWTAERHRLGESLIRAKVHGRRNRAYFLSGFDMQEANPLYFFCELPRGIHPATVAEAYEALKPATVKAAEQMGRTVHRQGDVFAIGLAGTTKRDLRREGATFAKRGQLLGTNHEATEVAYLPDGTTLARGTLWHSPPWRDPDHKRVTIGKAWHVIVKNTVPIAA